MRKHWELLDLCWELINANILFSMCECVSTEVWACMCLWEHLWVCKSVSLWVWVYEYEHVCVRASVGVWECVFIYMWVCVSVGAEVTSDVVPQIPPTLFFDTGSLGKGPLDGQHTLRPIHLSSHTRVTSPAIYFCTWVLGINLSSPYPRALSSYCSQWSRQWWPHRT